LLDCILPVKVDRSKHEQRRGKQTRRFCVLVETNTISSKLHLNFQGLKNSEEGQDLVEFALLVSLIALLSISGVSKVTTAVNSAFSNISSSLA